MQLSTQSRETGAPGIWPSQSEPSKTRTYAKYEWHCRVKTPVRRWILCSPTDSRSLPFGNEGSRPPRTPVRPSIPGKTRSSSAVHHGPTSPPSPGSGPEPEERNSQDYGPHWTTSWPCVNTGCTGCGRESSMPWAWRSPCASASATWPPCDGDGFNTRTGLSSPTTRSTRPWLPNQSRRSGKLGEGRSGTIAAPTTLTIPPSCQEGQTHCENSSGNYPKARNSNYRDGILGNTCGHPHSGR